MPIPAINPLQGNCIPPQLRLKNPGNPFSTLHDYIDFDSKNDAYRACLETDLLHSAAGQGGGTSNTLIGFFKSAVLSALTKIFIEGSIGRIKEFFKQIAKSNELAHPAK